VAEFDPSRLQVIAPYASHRMKVRYADALYSSPESLSTVQEAAIAEATVAATPRNANVVYKRTGSPKLAAKVAYLIRDTMKVVGHSEEFGPPICGLFYVDLSDPEAGGTGHTIRVCRQQGLPGFLDALVCRLSATLWARLRPKARSKPRPTRSGKVDA
jgi:hypothetical protein